MRADERLDYVVSPLRRRKGDPPVTPKSKLDEPVAASGERHEQGCQRDGLIAFSRIQ